MVISTALPPRSPMSPSAGQLKQTAKLSALKKLSGRAKSASPFKKMFGSVEQVDVPSVAEDYARVEITQGGNRDEFEEGRDMYDPNVGESRTLNSLTRSLSLGSTETDDDNTLDSATNEDSIIWGDEESLSSDARKESLPPPEGKVFTKSVVLTSLDNGEIDGESLALRAQHRDIKPDKENHVFINVRVSDYTEKRYEFSHVSTNILSHPLQASSISPFDVVRCRGVGVTKDMLPFTPGQVVIGTIEAIGKEVKLPFKIGDRVVGFVKQGGNARYVSAEVDNLIKASPNIKNSVAACLVEDWMTAYRALRIAKNAFKGAAMFGMNVFITDGFSPVGQAVIQLADLEGANIFCCANKCHHGYLQSLTNRTHCFAPQVENWLPDVVEKMDIVIDNTCVDGYASTWQALNDNGILICLATVNMGYSTRGCGILDIEDMLRKFSALKAKYTMSQTVFFDIREDFEKNRLEFAQDLMYLMFLVEQGKIHPKVGEQVGLDDVVDAQKLIANGKNNGTIVCLPWKKC